MAAYPPPGEERAGTIPFPLFVAEGIAIMLASKTHCEISEGDPISLLGITLGFLHLTY